MESAVTGLKQTPILGQVHGSGKTSSVLKFRNIYSKEDNQDSNRLKYVIYMNIRFDEGDSLPPADADNAQFVQAAQGTIACSTRVI